MVNANLWRGWHGTLEKDQCTSSYWRLAMGSMYDGKRMKLNLSYMSN